MASAATKLLFVCLCSDSHFDVTNNSILLYLQDLKANESRRAFLRYVFHEVRVPLNSISLGVQILRSSFAESSQEMEILIMVNEAVTFMGHTLNDTLAIQKLQEGALTLNFTPFSVKDHLLIVIASYDVELKDKSITCKVDINEEVPTYIIGDNYRLKHAISIILSNAIKFSAKHKSLIISVSQTRCPADPNTNDDGAWFKGYVEVRRKKNQMGLPVESNTESEVADLNNLVRSSTYYNMNLLNNFYSKKNNSVMAYFRYLFVGRLQIME